jgi:hypothetical protein
MKDDPGPPCPLASWAALRIVAPERHTLRTTLPVDAASFGASMATTSGELGLLPSSSKSEKPSDRDPANLRAPTRPSTLNAGAAGDA